MTFTCPLNKEITKRPDTVKGMRNHADISFKEDGIRLFASDKPAPLLCDKKDCPNNELFGMPNTEKRSGASQAKKSAAAPFNEDRAKELRFCNSPDRLKEWELLEG